jgi:tRNA wybutosine-synthesizing protein 3
VCFLNIADIRLNMDAFELRKKAVLQKKDQSFKQSIDSAIVPLCQTINALDAYYTTSSCSGRVQVYSVDDAHSKDSHTFLYVSHDANYDVQQLKQLYEQLKLMNKMVWILCESFILHVCAKTLEDAKRLQQIGIQIGLKRTALISFETITIECTHTASFCALVRDSTSICSFEFFCAIFERAKQSLIRTHIKIDQLKQQLSQLSKKQ